MSFASSILNQIYFEIKFANTEILTKLFMN